MNCSEFLENAKRLLREASNNPDESRARAIVHAAYYAVFHLCAMELKIDVEENKHGLHGAVLGKIKQDKTGNPVLAAAKTEYESLKLARVDADYYLSKQVGCPNASLALGRANRVFAAALRAGRVF